MQRLFLPEPVTIPPISKRLKEHRLFNHSSHQISLQFAFTNKVSMQFCSAVTQSSRIHSFSICGIFLDISNHITKSFCCYILSFHVTKHGTNQTWYICATLTSHHVSGTPLIRTHANSVLIKGCTYFRVF